MSCAFNTSATHSCLIPVNCKLLDILLFVNQQICHSADQPRLTNNNTASRASEITVLPSVATLRIQHDD